MKWSVHHIAKKLNMYPFMVDVTWVKWSKDLSVQTRWKALIQCERRGKKEECQCAEPHNKFQAIIPSFTQGKDQH